MSLPDLFHNRFALSFFGTCLNFAKINKINVLNKIYSFYEKLTCLWSQSFPEAIDNGIFMWLTIRGTSTGSLDLGWCNHVWLVKRHPPKKLAKHSTNMILPGTESGLDLIFFSSLSIRNDQILVSRIPQHNHLVRAPNNWKWSMTTDRGCLVSLTRDRVCYNMEAMKNFAQIWISTRR